MNRSVQLQPFCACILLCVFLSVMSCKEKPNPASQNKSTDSIAETMVLYDQDYNGYMGHIKLNETMLKAQGIKAYSASQAQSSGLQKSYYTNLSPTQNSIRFYEMSGKDTMVREKLISKSKQVARIEKVWKAISRKVILTEYFKNELHISVMNEKGKNDTTVTHTGHFIEYPNGERITYSNRVKDITEVTHWKADGTIRSQYEDELSKGLPTKRTYKVGSKHVYIFFYDSENKLTKIVWKESKEVHNATILFEYDASGLLSKRRIETKIPAFGNSVTSYSYQK